MPLHGVWSELTLKVKIRILEEGEQAHKFNPSQSDRYRRRSGSLVSTSTFNCSGATDDVAAGGLINPLEPHWTASDSFIPPRLDRLNPIVSDVEYSTGHTLPAI